MYAHVNGTKLFFDVEGAGFVPEGPIMKEKPVCFVLHGGPGGDHTGFKPALSPLAEEMQLVYIDNRGSGRSDKGPQSTYTLKNNVEDIEELRKYLGLDKIVLLGQSYGGMVALEYAKKYQENLKALLLVVTAPSSDFTDKAKEIVKEKGTPKQQEMAQVLWDGAFGSSEQQQEYYDVMAPLYLHSYEDTAEADLARENGSKRANRSYEALNEGFGSFLREYNVVDFLPSIHVPTLIIAGRHDWITPVEGSIFMNEQIPNSKLVIFEDSSHGVIKDEYDKFIATIKEYVKSDID
ncbi:alpha/beta fold hydrolase [Sporosarcina sp. G11-34]|uniref:alpha/beta fold hydrolase n=1 Tax=Sporosarcina sp. G11-34 TaxID=2849605 RepID=UPI0022A934B3|nr:alpha/beta fold hydrolase [Sporosarcina sp. G11-34]MCZ2257346.1 alpha/beta fold hydrolase [Sporosarcina sp. G11-34]